MPSSPRKTYFALRAILLTLGILLCLLVPLTSPGRRLAGAILSPAVSLGNALGRMVGDTLRWLQPGRLGRKEALREAERQIQELKIRLDALEDVTRENEELRRLLALPPRQAWRAVVAEVISRDPQRWNDRLLINRGARDGVVPGALVLVEGYAFGRVVQCHAHASEVVTLLSGECRFGVALSGNQAVGVLQGRGDEPFSGGELGFSVEYLPKDLEVTPEQQVVTSGLGGMMPPGIPVGRILADAPEGGRVHRPDLVRAQLHCVPLAPMGSLHFVMVMTPVN
ncbi:MAG: rod shape-determining protein MreC [Oligosphaeraceae bacterium]